MGIARALMLLGIFFVGLYILRDPVQHTGPNLDVMVVQPVKAFLAQLKTATTSLNDYSPLPGDVKPTFSVVPKVVPYVNATMTYTASRTADSVLATNKKEAASLPPVKADSPDISTGLTISGIIAATNIERQKAGLPALKESAQLDASAEMKLNDMFKNQYFEHVSPSGDSVADLATKAGYEYIVIGENLALGNFGGDVKVVAAWMASPGHKANILNTKYKDIGISVSQQTYQGKKQWIAVQHFGTPLSSCPSPSTSLKTEIDAVEKDLLSRETALAQLKKDIDQASGDEYKNKVATYNADAEAYNSQLMVLKGKIALYNDGVKKFNSCVGL